MRVTFSSSPRGEQMRFVVFGIASFLLATFLLDVAWIHALVVSVVVAGGIVAARIAMRSWRSSIVVDEGGIESRLSGTATRMAWGEVAGIEPVVAAVRSGAGEIAVRCAVVTDVRARHIAFADLGTIGPRPTATEASGSLVIHDVGDPEILLALVARRIGDERFLPAVVRDEPGDEPREPASGGRKVGVGGLAALVAKIGGKVGKAVAGLFKVVKPGFALVSGAVYAVLFDWKFAIGLMAMLLFHEYGHVHAMRRCGLPVRGIYFIPLLGAAAVSDGMWRTRGQQAYIALNGPLWGLYLTLPVAAAAILFGRAHPVLPALAAWWSLINLFNLLPVSPLDGGRLLTALSHSIHSRLGIVLSGAMFAAALALAYVLEIGLLVVVGLFGLMELVAELRAGRAMSRLRAAAIDPAVAPESLLALRLLVRPAFRDEDEERLRSLELGRIARMLAPARVEPMGRGPTVLWGLLYVSLVAAFVVVILLASSSPAGGLALDVLR